MEEPGESRASVRKVKRGTCEAEQDYEKPKEEPRKGASGRNVCALLFKMQAGNNARSEQKGKDADESRFKPIFREVFLREGTCYNRRRDYHSIWRR